MQPHTPATNRSRRDFAGAALRATVVLLLLLPPPLVAHQAPPHLMYIYRDSLKRGVDSAYRAIEDEAAQICADLKCPNPYLALESLSEPHEAWWLNGFAQDADTTRVVNAYAANHPLTEALGAVVKAKEPLIGTPIKGFGVYRPDLSRRHGRSGARDSWLSPSRAAGRSRDQCGRRRIPCCISSGRRGPSKRPRCWRKNRVRESSPSARTGAWRRRSGSRPIRISGGSRRCRGQGVDSADGSPLARPGGPWGIQVIVTCLAALVLQLAP